ncbi:hypothetical protein DFQ11_101934 [Winogradskyella epiphytica]|uniref:Uncharacterized protein n=1 Tax=Winogradskyella epiphytica TaxID=262005 RepID=A0A2V4X1E6_9FLAO|nr:hypothetical protein [Winogradskyella epiphytica]PYE83498.1 hypothetical protein DFQ11_101934 [Winogradskyella epiphytica]GGW58613.1 hypothetical protein GCM10008085_07910 [Winogradskyella epiphytica]
MKSNFNKWGIWIPNEDEKKQIQENLSNLKKTLDNYVEDEKIYLDDEISTCVTNENITRELERIKYHTIYDLEYNEGFKDVVYFKNGFVEFKQDENLYIFISTYRVLDDTARAQKVLQNILRVQLIDWLITNYYSINNAKEIKEYIKENITTLKDIDFDRETFENIDSEKFFMFAVSNWIETEPHKSTAIACLYQYLWIDTTFERIADLPYRIKKGHRKFAEYWNKNFSHIYEFKDTKQPKFKYHIPKEYRLKLIDTLNDFEYQRTN